MQTISEAYRRWLAIEAECNSEPVTDEFAHRLAAEQRQVEAAAAKLPATSAGDVWLLVAMASPDIRGDGGLSNALFRRARQEARALAGFGEEVGA